MDYRLAFDKINRTALWNKLLANGVNGKFLNIIRNLYMKAKSCVNVNHTLSDYLFQMLDSGKEKISHLCCLPYT